MTDRQAFAAAIRADLNNDQTRLVYADWLEKNGRPESADSRREVLEREVSQWKANHDEMVARNAVFRARHDVPIDQTDALSKYDAILAARKQEIALLQRDLDATGRFYEEKCREFVAARAENTMLRGVLSRAAIPCLHCGLDDMSRCVLGFPGCDKADDMMLGESEGFQRACARMKAAEEKASRYDWQPIDTVPPNRIVVLFAWIDGDANYKMHTGSHHPNNGDAEWLWEGRWLSSWDVRPTHWASLPEPPVKPYSETNLVR